jgi:peptidoglycan/LPS O-acetylase OafA/YrhL
MMFKGLRGTRASDHLDMVRGLAAVAVLVYHVRYRFFLDFGDVTERGPLAGAWYVLTAFGHDAVMVFFVVSGFLVGSATIRDCRSGQWSWRDYLTARCVRLYVVLVPGLLVTMLWDWIGLRWFGQSAIYTGATQWYRHDYFDVAARTGVGTLLANAAFLQGIFSPTFGSNDALWSLAFEFWYYVAFPLLAIGVLSRLALTTRLLYLLASAVVLYGIGGTMTSYFPIWLLGAGIGMLPSSAAFTRYPRRWAVVAGAVFAMWLFLSHTSTLRIAVGHSLWALDSCTGVVFGIWLYTFLHDRRASDSGTYGRVARRLANSSYTLYVVHLPLLILLRAWLVPDAPWTPTPRTIGMGCVIASVALVYAFIVASQTEAKTPTIRRSVVALLRRVRAPRDSKLGVYERQPQALP